MQVNRVS